MVAPLPEQELDPARSRVSAASLGLGEEARRLPLHLACLEATEGVSLRRTL